jgi:hypothetical protein
LVKDLVHIMARIAQISKEKWQSIITLRHESQSMLKVSWTSCAVTKTIKRYDETGSHEERKTQSYLCCRGFIRVNCTSDCSLNSSQRSSNRHISTSTAQRRLHEPGFHGQTATPIIIRDLLGPRNTSNGHKTCGNLSFGLMSLRFLVRWWQCLWFI